MVPWVCMDSVPARILHNLSGFSYHRHFNAYKWCQIDIVSITKGVWPANDSFICLPTPHIVVMYTVLQRECIAFQHKTNSGTAMLLLQVFLLRTQFYGLQTLNFQTIKLCLSIWCYGKVRKTKQNLDHNSKCLNRKLGYMLN